MRMNLEMNLEMKGLKTATVGWVSESDEEEPEWGGWFSYSRLKNVRW